MGTKCGRCSTRYCGPECQLQHWKEGGHDKLCKPIKKAGGAEQYNANKKYAEAVVVAAEACAEDTKGQTCYICTQALHWKTKEGLVRGCACRGTAGFAHVSCLAEQAKILFAEAEEDNLALKVKNARWQRWEKCSLCEQKYHGVVSGALGWACWKTYVSRPETDVIRSLAMGTLGNGLSAAKHFEDALSVQEARLSWIRRFLPQEEDVLQTQANLAVTYQLLGRFDEAMNMRRNVYSGCLKLHGEVHRETLTAANNLAVGLLNLRRFEEARVLLLKTKRVAPRILGENDETMFRMSTIYAWALYGDPASTLDTLREAVKTLEDTERNAQRVFGKSHPATNAVGNCLRAGRIALAARE